MNTYEPIPYKGNLEWLKSNSILVVNHGSVAYGLNTPESDLDIKGVVVPPKDYFLGFNNKFEQAESKDPDMVIYDIRKFFYLAAECNPSIIEVLWVDPSDYRFINILGEKLIDYRNFFLSKKARFSFSGYAIQQLKRISTHHRWLVSPPSHCPTREEFGLVNHTIIPQDQLAAAHSIVEKKLQYWNLNNLDTLDPAQVIEIKDLFFKSLLDIVGWDLASKEAYNTAAKSLGFSDNFIYLLAQEKAYNGHKAEWDCYQNWIKTRNPKRAALEAKYGYDCKHAMHLVRLLTMCKEILKTGSVLVKRPDRDFLLSIRNGAWTYEEVVEWAKKEDESLESIYNQSVLPHKPDKNKLDRVCINLVDNSFGML